MPAYVRVWAALLCSLNRHLRGQKPLFFMPNLFFNIFVCAISLSLLWGCHPGGMPQPDRLIQDEHASGDHQSGLHGELAEKPLRVVVQGKLKPGLLGGKGGRQAVPGATVRFSVVGGEEAAIFEESSTAEVACVTDAAGMASARLRLGSRSGDVSVEARMPAHPEIKPVSFRASVGITRIGRELQESTGGMIESFGVRLRDPDGGPAQGVDVYFRVEGQAGGSKVGQEKVVTDETGTAVTTWRLGDSVQQYFASVEIRDRRADVPEARRFSTRALEFEAMAVSKRQLLIVLLGGLAVFIFGMRNMSDGLQRIAARRLKQVLNFMTQNRVMAVLAGVLVTAMIQSSSATTVMALGFVNAGLMSLTQSIGVVFGANIGTTVTAQIIAFKLDALAYPAIALGLLLQMTSRNPQLKATGQAVLGFGLLFLGMQTMSGVLKPLRHSPEFVSYFQLFDCTPVEGGLVRPGPALMCVAIGTAMTCIIQSSSATVGLVLALASQGLLSFYTAVPLILGDNVGTTITANLAAIGGTRNARRTAMAHTLFNVFGAVYMYVLLFVPLWGGEPLFLGLVDAITPGEVFTDQPENLLRHVANAHSIFNVLNCLLFLPFVGVLATVCQRIIPLTEADRDTALKYLEPKLLKTPSVAINQAAKELSYMMGQSRKATREALDLFLNGRTSLAGKILEREDLVDRLQHEIAGYLVEITRRKLTVDEARLTPALLHAVNGTERLSDHAEELVELYHSMLEHDIRLPGAERADIASLGAHIDEQFENVFAILDDYRLEAMGLVNAKSKEIQLFIEAAIAGNVKRIDDDACDVQAGVAHLDALNHLQRVSEHLLNIAERAVVIVKVIAP